MHVETDAPSTRRRVRYGWVAGLAVVVAAAFGLRSLVRGVSEGRAIFREPLAREFFERYVDGDGRVVRRDQGSDTVSEGQAYAMLLAVALDDAAAFDRVWTWTSRALQRSDGLLSWHWVSGRVADREPASDADIDAAYALLLAGERFGNPGYLKEGRRIAEAVLNTETLVAGDKRILIAGPWARSEHIVNPSYIAPEQFRSFAETFGDDRWRRLHNDGVKLIEQLTSNGTTEPPDWARVDRSGRVSAVTEPVNEMPSSGLDAARVPVRFASSCDDGARRLAAHLRAPFAQKSDGRPLEIVAAAAAAHAAGDEVERDSLLARAEQKLRAQPTYYGWAWVALGRAMLDPRALKSCSGLLGLG